MAIPCPANQYICTIVAAPVAAITPAGNGQFQVGQNGIRFNIEVSDPLNDPADPVNNAFGYQWVQLLQARRIKAVSDAPLNFAPGGTGLDNAYPYPRNANGAIANEWGGDAPSVGLFLLNGTVLAELDDRFAAAMYLLWDPSLNASGQLVPQCSASSTWARNQNNKLIVVSTVSACYPNSIPVPLGYVTWGYCGDAINTQTPQIDAGGNATGTWKIDCSEMLGAPPFAAGNPAYQSANGFNDFPAWISTVANTGNATPEVKK